VNLLLQLVRGFFVGIAGLLPGLCGSTVLVLFGIYRPLTAALAHPLADFRRNLVRFGPFFLAAGLGLLVGSRVLATVFLRHETATLYLFMGFMAGALPDLFRNAIRAGSRPIGWLVFAAMFALCLALAWLQGRLVPHGLALEENWGVWLLAGAGLGLGSIVPGASVAFLLIYFGIYQPLLNGVAGFDLRVLLPVVLGAGVAILIFARAADWLFRKAEGAATLGVLGLVAGSILLIYPGWPGGASGLRCLFLFLLGAGLSVFLNQLAPPPRQDGPGHS
jgi:putative membrane protein